MSILIKSDGKLADILNRLSYLKPSVLFNETFGNLANPSVVGSLKARSIISDAGEGGVLKVQMKVLQMKVLQIKIVKVLF